MANSLNRGDIIEHDGQRFLVWEINGEFYGLLPSPQHEDATEQSPFYIAKSSTFKLIRRRSVEPFHAVPPNATFMLETCPTTEFCLTTMRLWTDGCQGHVELQHVRLAGVLGVSDGSLTQTGKVGHQDVADIERELLRIGYWKLTEKPDHLGTSGPWWVLKATDGTRIHSVERYGEANEIRAVCERCYDLINWEDLESGEFNIA